MQVHVRHVNTPVEVGPVEAGQEKKRRMKAEDSLGKQGKRGGRRVAQHQHSTAQQGTAQHGTARHGMARHRTAQRSTSQHSTAQDSTTQHGTAQHGTAVGDLLFAPFTDGSSIYR